MSTTAGVREFAATGAWTIAHAEALERLIHPDLTAVPKADAVINIASLEALDTFGAWTLERLVRSLHRDDQEPRIVGASERFGGLLEEVHRANQRKPTTIRRPNRILLQFER